MVQSSVLTSIAQVPYLKAMSVRGGNSTKIHLAVDSGGLPICFELSEGQKHNITHAESLVNQLEELESEEDRAGEV